MAPFKRMSRRVGPTVATVHRRHAFAKVNLTLDIGNLRADGYHELQSVMQTISLADEVAVTVTEAPGIVLRCTGPIPIGNGPDNLAYRAGAAVISSSGYTGGFDIEVDKRIPLRSGLGGGSADAAAVLELASRAIGWRPAPAMLLTMAAQIGSDVPFFLRGGTAHITGRGERVLPLPDIDPLHLVIVRPLDADSEVDDGVPTALAYQTLDELRGSETPSAATDALIEAITSGYRDQLLGGLCNDFMPVLDRLAPRSIVALDDLRRYGAAGYNLCGSGSAVFGVFDTADRAKDVAHLMSERWGWAISCRTVPSTECAAT